MGDSCLDGLLFIFKLHFCQQLIYFLDQCMYKGRIYTQGQKWDDGCDYSCECTDATQGLYTCTPM